MKVDLNLTSPVNNGVYLRRHSFVVQNSEKTEGCEKPVDKPILNYANFPNISFKNSPGAQLLLKYNGILNCAYTGRQMLYKGEFDKIAYKLLKRQNALSAINLLRGYAKYMYAIETEIFDIFDNADHKNKLSFNQILNEYVPSSLERLKDKQERILTSTTSITEKLTPVTRELVTNIVEQSMVKIEDGTFTRKFPLDQLRNVKGNADEVKELINIYHAWYQLPRSCRDIDAFIVSYAKESHETIAKRLLTPSVASIEHIVPRSRKGEDSMRNYLLVCRQINGERSSMLLDEYIMLNPDLDIPKNLQRYMDAVIREIGVKDSLMSTVSWYPEAIKETILEESSGYVNLDTSKLILSKEQIRENNSPKRLKDKYNVK